MNAHTTTRPMFYSLRVFDAITRQWVDVAGGTDTMMLDALAVTLSTGRDARDVVIVDRDGNRIAEYVALA